MMNGMQVQLWEEGLIMFCRVTLPLRVGGTLSILAKLDSRTIVKALHARGVFFVKKGNGRATVSINGVEGPDQEIGSFFGAIGKAIKKVAKSSVLKKALSLGKMLANSPLGTLVAPGAALAIKAAEGAAKLVSAAKSKNPRVAQKAKIALVAANAQAKAENAQGKQLPLPSGVANRSPTTRAAYRYLVTVARSAA